MGVTSTRKACIGEYPTYTAADIGRTAWNIIRHFTLVGKSAFAVFVRAIVFVRWNMFLTLCRLALRSVFVLPRHPGGGNAP